MPELPEVETVVRLLRPSVEGVSLLGHHVLDEKLQYLRRIPFSGRRIAAVERIGKQIVLRLSEPAGGEAFLAIHLRMSGRLLWIEGKFDAPELFLPETLPAQIRYLHDGTIRPSHVRFVLRGTGGALLFVDPRRFGTVRLVPSAGELSGLGVDPLRGEFSEAVLSSLMAGSRQPVKPWLLRQDRIVGIGNIYASEILHRSGIHPETPVCRISQAGRGKLAAATVAVLSEAVECAGTTFSDFQTPNGESGGFQEFLAVYEREGLPCRSCEGTIRRSVQAGRSTYHCPKCQKRLPRRREGS